MGSRGAYPVQLASAEPPHCLCAIARRHHSSKPNQFSLAREVPVNLPLPQTDNKAPADI